MKLRYSLFLLPIMLVLICASVSLGQVNYTFSATTGTFTPLSGASAFSWTTTTAGDEEYSTATLIGFNFSYCGTSFSQLQVSTNGFLRFGNDLTGATPTDALTGTLRNIIAPLWDDLAVTTSGAADITYLLSGSAPSRTLTVQWNNVKWNKTAGAANAQFQVILYETSNRIDIQYGTMAAPTSGAASIGLVDGTVIAGNSFTTGKFLSINVGGSGAFHRTMGLPFNSINTAPASSTLFTFTVVTPTPIATGSYTVGGASPTYATLSDAAMALNINGIAGPVVLSVRSGTYDDIFHLINVSGTSATNTITLQKESGTVTLSPLNGGASTTAPSATFGDAMIRLDGTQRVTIDGLTFIDNPLNLTTTTKFDVGVLLANSIVALPSGVVFSGARYNTLQNLSMDMNATTGAINTGATGIRLGTIGSATDTTKSNSYNTIKDVTIVDFFRSAIRMFGFFGINPDRGNKITATSVKNTLGTVSLNSANSDVRVIEIDDQADLTIEKTMIKDVVFTGTSTTQNIYGIWFNPGGSSIDFSSGTLTMDNLEMSNLQVQSPTTATTGIAAAINSNRLGDGATMIIKNCIFSNILSNGTTARAEGALLNVGSGTGQVNLQVYNNFIYDIKAPKSTTLPSARGLDIQAASGGAINAQVYYNSIFLDNALPPTAATHGSAGIYVSNFGSSFLDLRNNVIVNLMAQAGAGVATPLYASANSNLLRLTPSTNNNLYYAGATPSATKPISYDAATANQTLAAHKAAVATGGLGGPRDVASVTENPPFLSSVSPYDLHISTSTATQVEKGAQPLATVTTDIDGNTRDAVTPDIGADEGSFTQSDLLPPTLTYASLSNTSASTSRPLVSFATITDPSGVNATSGTNPRIYYKRSTDANTVNDNTSGTDGWKYAEASNASSPFSFTIDYSLLNGGTGVSTGTVVQYFVVAQDLAASPNVAINSGTFATPPSSVNLVAANFPLTGTINSYTIANLFSGALTVGATGYPSLTGVGGLFEALNAGVVTGNLTVTINADLTEDGTNALNQLAEEGAGGYTVTIQPDGTTERVIAGTVANGMIRLNGADRVTIDGRFGGSGKYLRFRNANTSNPTITFVNDAQNNTISYCYIEGASTSTANGVVFFSSGTAAGNDNNTIDNCDIRDLSSAAANPRNCVFSLGSTGSTALNNSGNTLSNSNIYNFFVDGGTGQGIVLSEGNTSWTISGNSLYQTATRTGTAGATGLQGIAISYVNGGNFLITGNSIGGSAPNAGGTPLTLTSTTQTTFIYTIRMTASTAAPSSIQGNTITNISLTTNANTQNTLAFSGVLTENGTINIGTVTGNTIGSGTATGAIQITNFGTAVPKSAGLEAISVRSAGGDVKNNVVGGFSLVGGANVDTLNFTGILLSTAVIKPVVVSGNTVGSATTSNSVTVDGASVSASSATGILSQAASRTTITANTVANINNATSSLISAVRGITHGGGAGPGILSNNQVYNLSTASTNTSQTNGLSAAVGIVYYSSSGSALAITAGGYVTGNTIRSINLTNTGAVSTVAAGINAVNASYCVVANNKVYDITNASTGTTATAPPIAAGILLRLTAVTGGGYEITNNMVSLGLGQTTNTEYIGIGNNLSSAVPVIAYYNSVYIGGTVASGALPSFAFLRGDNSTTSVPTPILARNNVLYNERTGGTGSHYAIGNQGTSPSTGWLSTASNYNLLVTASPTTVGLWGSTACTFALWKSSSGGSDANSWSDVNTNVASANLFTATATADLNILTANPEAWYVNGKGIALTGIGDDFGATAVRSTAIATGATDIGADEMTPSSIPPSATWDNVPSPGVLSTYTFAGRQVGTISWSDNPSVPTAIAFKYYSGTTPPGSPSGYFSNAYWDVAATGSFTNTYDITLNYDPAMTGTITSEATTRMDKRDGTNPWVHYSDATVNTTSKTVTKTGLSSLSQFLLSDEASPLFANVKVMLQGPYNTGTSQMDNALKTGGYLTARFGPNVKSTAVDSITVEIRNAPTAAGSTIRLFQPAWLLQDGTIVSFNDSTKAYTAYSGAPAGNYYIVIWHRNHLAIMSATAQALTGSAPPAYDFTTGQSQAFGVNPMIQVNAAPVVFAMVAGDGDGTGVVVAADANAVFGALSVPGYNNNDINLSGLVSASDANVVFGNLSRATQVSRPVQNPGETGVELGKVTRKLPAVINKENE